MEIGIVGLPNVGKSTLFNALTGAAAAASNFPFTTIDPNVGIVPLPDPRLTYFGQKFASKKVTPSGIRFVDIAGLVKGASKGEGLGNQFLSNIRTVDAIAHVVRAFKDENVVNVLGKIDPQESADVIETELLLSDLQQSEKLLDKLQGPARTGDKKAKEKLTLMEGVVKAFKEGKSARNQGLAEEVLAEFQFLTGKPLLYVANTDEKGADPAVLEPLKARAAKEGAQIVVLCAKLEAEIIQLPPEERAAYYAEAGITSPGLAELAQAGKKLLKQICFFTVGPDESRAWLIPQGTRAQKAAGKIHSDIERGFIRAEKYRYEDFVKHGSEAALKEKGLVTMEGKDYLMQDGDVVNFRFNV